MANETTGPAPLPNSDVPPSSTVTPAAETVAEEPGPDPLKDQRLTLKQILDKRTEAKDKRAAFMAKQKSAKAKAALAGAVVTLAGVGAPALQKPSESTTASTTQTMAISKTQTAGMPFPAYIGSCGVDGGRADGKPLGDDDKHINDLKNRIEVPGEAQISDTVTIDNYVYPAPAKDLQRKSDVLNEEMAATVTGYIVKIISGGAETCNCQTPNQQFWDTHIYLSKDDPTKRPALPKGTSPTQHDMIAEITPRMRGLLKPGSHDWDTPTLQKAFPVGTKVKVTGWQFYDKEHEPQSFILHGKPSNWRYSCWEIHPVTSIEKTP